MNDRGSRVFAGEIVRPDYTMTAPDVGESELAAQFQVVSLEGLGNIRDSAETGSGACPGHTETVVVATKEQIG
jgi:hypothetical protein